MYIKEKNSQIYLLDCTLRDGGYVNDWEFSREIYDSVSKNLQTANIDFIELGIMGTHNADRFKTKFRSFEEVPVPQKIDGGKSNFTIMMTGTEYKKMTICEYSSQNSVDAVRFLRAIKFLPRRWQHSSIRRVSLSIWSGKLTG